MELDEEENATTEGLDNEDNEMTEQLSDEDSDMMEQLEQLDDDSAVLEVVDSPPPVTVQLPPLQDPETFFMFETQVVAVGVQSIGGMHPSAEHANIVGQQGDMDEEELDDDELEEDIRNAELMLEQDSFASRTGSASLRMMMDANLHNLQSLLHGT